MPVKVKDSPQEQPDVSKVTPVYVPVNSIRSPLLDVTIINGQGKYQVVKGAWNDLEKRWEYESGLPIEYEVVKTDPITGTEDHYPEEI